MKYIVEIINSILELIAFIVLTPLGWIGMLILWIIFGGGK